MNYNNFSNPIKRAFYREAHAFVLPHPTDNKIEMMWKLWWLSHRDTELNLRKKYYDNPNHQEWSIYDWNVDMYDWWLDNEKHITNKLSTHTSSVFDNMDNL